MGLLLSILILPRMASDTETSPNSETSQDNQSYITAVSQQEDFSGVEPMLTEKLLGQHCHHGAVIRNTHSFIKIYMI